MKNRRKHSKKRRLFDLLLLAVLPLLFYSCVDSMIFHPPACSYSKSTHTVMIPTTTGRQIAACYLPASESGNQYTVLFSHGNAEDIGYLRDFVQNYHLQGFGILAYDYAGYGLSKGTPTEKNTYEDIEAAYQFLAMHEHIDPNRIIIHGRSVGSGPSVWLARQYPSAGLILESPFISIYRVITRWPIIPFDKYNNLSRIKDIHCPVLVIHGRNDRVVPFRHGQTLFDAANEPKMHLWVDNAGHNDLVHKAGQTYWKTLQNFKQTLNHEEGTEPQPHGI